MSEAAQVETPPENIQPEPNPAPEAAPSADPSPPQSAAPSADPTPAQEPPTTPTSQPAAQWGDDWRTAITGGEPDPTLDRFDSPKGLFDAYNAMRNKMSSGELTTKLSDEPSEDELAAYRKDNGIPTEFKDYEMNLPEGFTFGEEDQQFVDQFLEKMHGTNATPSQVNAALNVYAEMTQQAAEQDHARHDSDRQVFEDTMRVEWGADYRKNVNVVNTMLDSYTPEFKEIILNGRDSTGRALMNNPDFARAMTNLALELNPAHTIAGMSGGNAPANVKSRIAELKAEMDTDYNAWRSDAYKSKRDEYDKLLAADAKLQKRK